ncbi:unnamed protein product [Cylicostephanus goldi]|uniref:Uncharacterized protein n=1 Tax=Cylicostephanus goldi TaxID=71465 RepID=A0A3P7N297_CYLGO|nr:unnamed protein product [Cylicostephanus goldi]
MAFSPTSPRIELNDVEVPRQEEAAHYADPTRPHSDRLGLEITIPQDYEGFVLQSWSPGVYPGSPGALEETRWKHLSQKGQTNQPPSAEVLDDQMGKQLNSFDFRFRGLQGS